MSRDRVLGKNGLLDVRTFVLPTAVITETVRFLRHVGNDGVEGFVLWAGELATPTRFAFQTCVIPDQRAMKTPNGLLVTVDGQALFRVNKLLHEQKRILGAQVHSHPTDAYHSSTDDAFPLATLVGALSVVIPDFARNAPNDLDAWAWYRLSRRGKWNAASESTEVEFE